MKAVSLLLAAALLAGLLSACGQTPPPSSVQTPSSAPQEEVLPPEPPAPPAPPTNKERAADWVSTLSLQEKVGQIFFIRCPESGAAEWITENHVGGLLLFSRDFKDKSAETIIGEIQAYQANAAIPLLIGVDEEGGTVVRASSNPKLRTKKFQSPQRVFAAGSWAALTADTMDKDAFLKNLGINVNLAPVADVSTDPGDFINDRSFGQDATQTAQFVPTVVTQMAADGMGSVLKHFPGYGNNVDTHTGISTDQRPLEQFKTQDFLPFQAGMQAGDGTTAVLVSHNIMNCVDQYLPASLSHSVHALLRNDLAFDGVVMTDDLVMDAVKAYADNGSAATLAVLAGNDLLISSDYAADMAAVTAAVEDGTIPMVRLDEAVTRVLIWKMELGLV